MIPFEYPERPHHRKHGPAGYADYERFRSWLRDEFSFRCVFCLTREQWIIRYGGFAVDHFIAVSRSSGSVAAYENLLYACNACNLAKAAHRIPDPTQALTAASIVVDADGQMKSRTSESQTIIRTLGLNAPRYIQFRRQWITIIALARQSDPVLHGELMSYPADLPNLSRLRPPGGNSRPEGVAESCFARRERGELAEVYSVNR